MRMLGDASAVTCIDSAASMCVQGGTARPRRHCGAGGVLAGDPRPRWGALRGFDASFDSL